MKRFPRRLVPAVALLALTAAALPARSAAVFGWSGAADADVYYADVKVPGGSASVILLVVRQAGVDVFAGTGVPDAEPYVGGDVFGCVSVQRGRSRDSGCSGLDVSAGSVDTQLESGRLRFTVPSRTGKGTLTADLTLTATDSASPEPDYHLDYSVPDFAVVYAGMAMRRPASATGTVTSTKVGGGKVGTTSFGLLAREQWADATVFSV